LRTLLEKLENKRNTQMYTKIIIKKNQPEDVRKIIDGAAPTNQLRTLSEKNIRRMVSNSYRYASKFLETISSQFLLGICAH
jgi:hypothetical protein